jgi:Tol biopolymer transport system component
VKVAHDFQAGLIAPRNLTNSADKIDEDADWSPLGDKIAYTSKNVDPDEYVYAPSAAPNRVTSGLGVEGAPRL